jgi:hypothetical protein
MKALKLLLAFAGSSFIFLGAGCGGANSAALVLGQNYFPTSFSGAFGFWEYRNTSPSAPPENWTFTYAGNSTFAGQSTLLFNEVYPGDPVKQSHFQVGTSIASIGFTGDGTETHSNDKLVSLNAVVGSTEVVNDVVTGDNNGSVTWTITRLPDETVTVPVGTFNCVKVRRVASNIVGSVQVVNGETQYLWLAPNVGIVKAQTILPSSSTPAGTDELVEYGEAI